MKKIKPILIVLTLVAFMAGSCKKGGSLDTSNTASLTLKFNGASRAATVIVAQYIKADSSIQVSGNFGATEAVSILVQKAKVGSFDIATDNVIAAYLPDTVTTDAYLGTSGNVTITSFTSEFVSGTFSFKGVNGAGTVGTVTNGTFTAKVISQ